MKTEDGVEGTCLPSDLLAIFFALRHMVKKLFLKDLSEFYLNLMFTSKPSKKNVAFLDLKVKLKQGNIETDLHPKITARPLLSLYFLTPGAH